MNSTAAPLSPSNVRERANKFYDRHFGTWAACILSCELRDTSADSFPYLPWSIPLHTPSERAALANLESTRQWVLQWRAAEVPGDAEIEWAKRSWPTVGTQSLPVRFCAHTPEALACVANRGGDWQTACSRMAQLGNVLARCWGQDSVERAAEQIAQTAKRRMRALCAMNEDDWSCALSVLEWLFTHPDEPRFIRELPIYGIDTKWLERHWGTIRPLYEAASGRDYQFSQLPSLVRFRCLDAELAPLALSDMALPRDGFCSLDKQETLAMPQRVIVCENLTTMLALPPLAHTMAIHGGGYRVGELEGARWLASRELYYWGDLDTNGFAILNRFRSHFPNVKSILMDEETLLRHASLCGVEERPNRGTFDFLTMKEQNVLEILNGKSRPTKDAGFPSVDFGEHALRLEQERVSWPWALKQLGLDK